jgi:hypothetical protein
MNLDNPFVISSLQHKYRSAQVGKNAPESALGSNRRQHTAESASVASRGSAARAPLIHSQRLAATHDAGIGWKSVAQTTFFFILQWIAVFHPINIR